MISRPALYPSIFLVRFGSLPSNETHADDLAVVLLPAASIPFLTRTSILYTTYADPRKMASNRVRRVGKELADIQKDSNSSIKCRTAGIANDITHLTATFPGPPDTPYEGGVYVVDIKIPNEYPFKPPVMYFVTKLWHPNVSSQTVSCLSYLIDFSDHLGCNLSGYSWFCLVTSLDNQVGPALSSVTS